MLKIFRRISAGVHPEAEMGRYLTRARLRQFAGAARRGRAHRRRGRRHALAVAQGFMRNQGDAWTWTLTSSTAPSTISASREAAAERAADDVERLPGLRRHDRPAARARCTSCWRADRRPAFAPRIGDRRGRRSAGSSGRMAAARRGVRRDRRAQRPGDDEADDSRCARAAGQRAALIEALRRAGRDAARAR